MRGLNFLIHYNKVEVYALIFGHILFKFGQLEADIAII
jgi:hypothetical protein